MKVSLQHDDNGDAFGVSVHLWATLGGSSNLYMPC